VSRAGFDPRSDLPFGFIADEAALGPAKGKTVGCISELGGLLRRFTPSVAIVSFAEAECLLVTLGSPPAATAHLDRV
jgi:hypothetical protein